MTILTNFHLPESTANIHKAQITTFALRLSIFDFTVNRRGVRVADRARLESVCTARYRGFESLPLRKLKKPGSHQTHNVGDGIRAFIFNFLLPGHPI
jgi:hypothetical protein